MRLDIFQLRIFLPILRVQFSTRLYQKGVFAIALNRLIGYVARSSDADHVNHLSNYDLNSKSNLNY